MTKEEIIDNIARLNSQTWKDREEVRTEIGKLLAELNKSLEQQPCEDVMAIHTQGLDEGIRCAMCTNIMKSDRNCDGGCRVDEVMYKKVMETINNQMFSQPTSDDCVSRQAVIDTVDNTIAKYIPTFIGPYEKIPLELAIAIRDISPVTPTHGTCKDCTNYVVGALDEEICIRGHELIHENFYCADYEKRGNENV